MHFISNRSSLLFTLLALFLASPGLVHAQGNTGELRTLADSASYLVGYRFGNSLLEQNARLNHDILLVGVIDALNPGTEGRLSHQELEVVAMKADSIERALMARMQGGDTNFDAQAVLYGDVSTNGPERMSVWNDSMSYIVGFSYGSNLQQRGYTTNPVAFSLGMEDRLEERIPRIDEQGELLVQLGLQQMKEEQAAERPDYSEQDAAFMNQVIAAGNAERMENGILYEILAEGDDSSVDGDTLVLHIVSSFVGEDPFYDSRAENTPLRLGRGEVAPFLKEALDMMTIGSKYRVYIPGEVAFANAPPEMPRRVTIYDIELIGVE